MKLPCKTIYSFGSEHVGFEIDKPVRSFTRSLTDQSYYVPASESAKLIGETSGQMSAVSYDNSSVTDDLIDLRRPGLDRVECETLVESIKADTLSKVDDVLASAYNSKVAELEKSDAINGAIASVAASNTDVTSAN